METSGEENFEIAVKQLKKHDFNVNVNNFIWQTAINNRFSHNQNNNNYDYQNNDQNDY